MGSRYNNKHMHHQHLHPRTTFLPMLCSRTSVKDVHRRRPPNPSSSTLPSSPTVTCMGGHVNRSNRVTGYPPAASSPIKHHKLIRLFSGKNAAAITNATAGRSADQKKIIVTRSLSERRMGYRDRSENACAAAVNVAELDPPLPVVKRRQQPAAAAADGNLWKRRSGGGCELESLQLQPIRLPDKRCVLQPVSTV